MFQQKRGDTLIGTIEREYGINLNTRADTLLRNLLQDRGFSSLSQLLDAYYGKLNYHPRRRKVFLSFHAEDIQQVNGFRLTILNPNLDFDIYDASIRTPVNSENSSYIKEVIRGKIARASVVLCLVGDGTAWRDWVEWELAYARSLGKGICGLRLKGSRGRTPPFLREIGVPVESWGVEKITPLIERAAAKRS